MPESDKHKKKSAPVATRAPVANRGPFPERMRIMGDGKGLVPSTKKRASKKARAAATRKK